MEEIAAKTLYAFKRDNPAVCAAEYHASQMRRSLVKCGGHIMSLLGRLRNDRCGDVPKETFINPDVYRYGRIGKCITYRP